MKNVRYMCTALFFVVIFASMLYTSVFADFDMSVSLEKVGEIPEADLDYKSIEINPTGLIATDADGNYYVLDEMGNNHLDRCYGKAEYFTDDYFLVYDVETWPNPCGLVKSDGTVVLPCEAAIIERIQGTDRYLKISVATEEADKEDAFLYSYSGWVAWPTEQSEYYDGYSQFYDLQEGEYFEDWDDADLSELQGVYHLDKINKDEYAVVAEDGTVVTELDFWPYEIYGDAELFSNRVDDGHVVVDRNGDPISDIVFKAPPTETNGYLWAVKAEDEQAKTVMDFDGKVYADGADEISNVKGQPYGFVLLYNSDDRSLLLYPDGTVAELGKNDGAGMLPIYRKGTDGEPNSIFVLNKGKYVDIEEEYLSRANMDGNLMFLAKYSDENEYSLYSAADGSILLDKGGSKILSSDDWVYALKDGVWSVYKVTVDY